MLPRSPLIFSTIENSILPALNCSRFVVVVVVVGVGVGVVVVVVVGGRVGVVGVVVGGGVVVAAAAVVVVVVGGGVVSRLFFCFKLTP